MGRLLQLGVIMPKGGLDEVRGSAWLHQALRAAPPWLADHVLAHRDAIVGPTPPDVLVGHAPRWSAPGVVLLGDAAHPMSPVRAQGINLALRDAVVAANHLAPLARRSAGPDAIAAACRAFQAEREPEVSARSTCSGARRPGRATPAPAAGATPSPGGAPGRWAVSAGPSGHGWPASGSCGSGRPRSS